MSTTTDAADLTDAEREYGDVVWRELTTPPLNLWEGDADYWEHSIWVRGQCARIGAAVRDAVLADHPSAGSGQAAADPSTGSGQALARLRAVERAIAALRNEEGVQTMLMYPALIGDGNPGIIVHWSTIRAVLDLAAPADGGE